MGQQISAAIEDISREKTASREINFTASLSNRQYNMGQTISAVNSLEMISEDNENAASFQNIATLLSISGETNIAPFSHFSHRSYNIVAISGTKMSSEKNQRTYNIAAKSRKNMTSLKNTKSYESQITHFAKEKFIVEIITEIVRYLAKNDNYEVYGYWFCRQWQCEHEPHCQNKSQCKYADECHEREFPYTRESLEKYLETPEELCDLFKKQCVKCDKMKLITSFRLYKRQSQENLDKKLAVEIICHLEWENHYRVFGSWKCSHCRKKWKSAYTWISLQKFIEQTPGMCLNQDDYFMQKCKKCKECKRCNNDKNIIFSYEALVQSEDGIEHKMELCAKCNHYKVKCVELESYYGDKHKSL